MRQMDRISLQTSVSSAHAIHALRIRWLKERFLTLCGHYLGCVYDSRGRCPLHEPLCRAGMLTSFRRRGGLRGRRREGARAAADSPVRRASPRPRMPCIDGAGVLHHLEDFSARPIVFLITGHQDASRSCLAPWNIHALHRVRSKLPVELRSSLGDKGYRRRRLLVPSFRHLSLRRFAQRSRRFGSTRSGVIHCSFR